MYKFLNFFSGNFLGIRHVQAVMLFFALVLAYGMRVNMSIAIVAMTDKDAVNVST